MQQTTLKPSGVANGDGIEDDDGGVGDDDHEEKPYPLPLLPPWAPPEAVIILNDRPRQKTLH